MPGNVLQLVVTVLAGKVAIFINFLRMKQSERSGLRLLSSREAIGMAYHLIHYCAQDILLKITL